MCKFQRGSGCFLRFTREIQETARKTKEQRGKHQDIQGRKDIQATFKFDGKNQFGHIYNVQHRRARQIKTPSEKDLLSLVPSGDHPWFTLQRKYLLRHLHLIEKASTPGALLQSDIRVVVAKLDVVGIGNQLVQIISTLLFAMLTNRTL